MLILAGVSLNATIGENGIVTRAQQANLSQDLAVYKEELEVNKTGIKIEKINNAQDFEDLGIYVVGEEVKKYIPSLKENYVGRIAIFDSELVYTSENITENEKKVTDNLGILIMQTDDYNYMIELNYLAMAVAVHSEDSVKIGTALGTAGNTYETIAGINYGLGWYKISSTEELKNLGLTETELTYMTHGPYIVKYSTAAVQSIAGKLMYAGTTNEIWKYTFNYSGEEGGIIVENLLSGVDGSSTKTETQWGNFSNVDDGFEYVTDENGNEALSCTGDTTGNMPIDQTININKAYTVLVTVKGSIEKTDGSLKSAEELFHEPISTVLAMSDLTDQYVSTICIKEGYLVVISYRYNFIKGHTYAEEPYGTDVIDISEYDNKYMNIQVTAERNGKTKVYINGILKTTFDSGKEEFTYENLTIGDLRPNRGLRYVGNIYNVGIYGEALTEEQIAQNWNYTKNELGINEAGDKVN